jgi:hypothetical protein
MEAFAIAVLILTGLAFLLFEMMIPFVIIEEFTRTSRSRGDEYITAFVAFLLAASWAFAPIGLLFPEPRPGTPLPPMWFVYASLANGILPVLLGFIVGYCGRDKKLRRRCLSARHA